MTGDPLQLSLADLRRAFDLLMHHAETVSGDGVLTLDQDYFWSVPQESCTT